MCRGSTNTITIKLEKNYSERLPDHRTPIKNLYLANTTQIYPEDRGTNYSVRMGKRVANLILEDIVEPDA